MATKIFTYAIIRAEEELTFHHEIFTFHSTVFIFPSAVHPIHYQLAEWEIGGTDGEMTIIVF